MISEEDANFLPVYCPSCGSKLEWSFSKTDLICSNELCPAQIIYYIEHFVKVMGIEDLSATSIEKFNISSIEDLYNLTEKDITNINGFGKKSAANIIEQLQKSLIDVDPAKLIEAFGIPNLGTKNAENLVRKFSQSTDNVLIKFLVADESEFLVLDGFGPRVVNSIMEMREYCKELYKFLSEKGLTLKSPDLTSCKLQNLKICMTGSCPDKRSRTELSKILESHGAEVQNGVTKKTNLLIAEDIHGKSSKLKKARELGIKIVNYSFFEEL